MYTCYYIYVCALATAAPTFQIGDVRLVNTISNTNMSGRLEVYYLHQWGTVCDNLFNSDAALVVCRQLGFNPFGAIVVSRAHFGQGVGPIWLDNVRCSGSEPNIDSCSHNAWGSHNCDHSKDVGVICHGESVHHYVRTYIRKNVADYRHYTYMYIDLCNDKGIIHTYVHSLK